MTSGWSISAFRAAVQRWAASQDDVIAVVLVGSYASGRWGPSSDVDLVLVVEDPQRRLDQSDWLGCFGRPRDIRHGDFGPVQSRFVRYPVGPEIEFGLTSRGWLDLVRDDAQTRRIVHRGAQIWYDPTGDAASALERGCPSGWSVRGPQGTA